MFFVIFEISNGFCIPKLSKQRYFGAWEKNLFRSLIEKERERRGSHCYIGRLVKFSKNSWILYEIQIQNASRGCKQQTKFLYTTRKMFLQLMKLSLITVTVHQLGQIAFLQAKIYKYASNTGIFFETVSLINILPIFKALVCLRNMFVLHAVH